MRDTVDVGCCTASSDFPPVVGVCTTCSADGSGEGWEVNMSARKVSFRWYLSLSSHGNGVCTTCFIGGNGGSTEVNTSAKKVSFLRKRTQNSWLRATPPVRHLPYILLCLTIVPKWRTRQIRSLSEGGLPIAHVVDAFFLIGIDPTALSLRLPLGCLIQRCPSSM